MNILALDLGTQTGWALWLSRKALGVLSPVEELRLGTERLATPKEVTAWGKIRMTRRADPRISRLHKFLTEGHHSFGFDWIIFEDVTFATSQYQTQLWASLRSAAWLTTTPNRLAPQFECCPVTTLKKFATGKPGAKKEDMARALVATDSRFKLDGGKVIDQIDGATIDDNAVDALFLLKWGKNILKVL